MKNDITILDCTENHKELLFKWANDADVRVNSLNSDLIMWDDHLRWFDKKIHSVDTAIYIGVLNNVPFGQVRFDLSDNYFHIDYSINKTFRGNGLAVGLLKLCIQRFVATTQREVHFLAQVKKDNIASIKVFKRLNFTEVHDPERQDLKLFLFRS